MTISPKSTDAKPQLVRGIGLGSANALNMIDMIGVGPLITITLIVTALCGARRVRWSGVGGTRGRNAGFWRLLSIFEGDLRPSKIRASGFISFYLAIVIQRPTFDRLGSRRAFAVRIFLLAGATASLGCTHL